MGLFDFLKHRDAAIKKDSISVSVQEDVLPIEKRIKGKSAVCDGLYPHEVLVLSYAPKFYESGNDYQQFWWHKYGIRNVGKILESLRERGLIQQGTIRDAIDCQTLPVIKESLSKHGLSGNGKKAALIERLVDNVSADELKVDFPRIPYTLTEYGKSLLKKYEWIPFIHSHLIEDLNIWNLTEKVQSSNHNYRDTIWGYLNECSLVHAKNHNFGLYRNSRFTMSEFVADEGKTETAFSLLCEVVAYDLSGLSNNFDINHLYILYKSYFPYEKSVVKMAPGITNRIKKYMESFGWSEKVLHQRLEEEINKIQLPFRLFTDKECADIVLCEMNGNEASLKKIYRVAEKRFMEKYAQQIKSPY